MATKEAQHLLASPVATVIAAQPSLEEQVVKAAEVAVEVVLAKYQMSKVVAVLTMARGLVDGYWSANPDGMQILEEPPAEPAVSEYTGGVVVEAVVPILFVTV